MRDQIAVGLGLFTMLSGGAFGASAAAPSQSPRGSSPVQCQDDYFDGSTVQETMQVEAKGVVSPLHDSIPEQLLAQRINKGASARVYLLLEGLQSRRGTSVSFEVSIGPLDAASGRLLSNERVDEFVIFDRRPHLRSTDVTNAVANFAKSAFRDVPLGVSIRPDLGDDAPSEAFRLELAQAGVTIDAACLVIN